MIKDVLHDSQFRFQTRQNDVLQVRSLLSHTSTTGNLTLWLSNTPLLSGPLADHPKHPSRIPMTIRRCGHAFSSLYKEDFTPFLGAAASSTEPAQTRLEPSVCPSRNPSPPPAPDRYSKILPHLLHLYDTSDESSQKHKWITFGWSNQPVTITFCRRVTKGEQRHLDMPTRQTTSSLATPTIWIPQLATDSVPPQNT